MFGQKPGDLGFDRLGQQGTRSIAQDLGQMVGEDPWLNQLDDVIVGHGVSLLRWRSGGLTTPTIRRLANSRRPGGTCFAGKEFAKGRSSTWIRPVNAAHNGAVSGHDRLYEDGSHADLLDVVKVSLQEAKGMTPTQFNRRWKTLDYNRIAIEGLEAQTLGGSLAFLVASEARVPFRTDLPFRICDDQFPSR